MLKRTSLVLLVATGSIAGCQRTADIQERPAFSMSPLVIDSAIQHRNWEPSVVEYPNGDVVAGPTLFPYETRRTDPGWQQALFAPVLFVGQTIALPFHAFVTPPWSQVAYQGVDFEPSYTAVPPLPPTDPQVLAALRDRPAAPAPTTPAPQPQTPSTPPATEADEQDQAVDQAVEQLTEPAVVPPPATPEPAPAPRQSEQPRVQTAPPTTQPELNK